MSSVVLAGHRGYSVDYAENTIPAYDAAVDAGCKVVETDLHISKDLIIVISHDAKTSRIFGKTFEIPEENYEGTLSEVRTVADPHLPMPTFVDVLQWFVGKIKSHPGLQLMLDIKRDCDPEKLMELILADLKSVGPSVDWWHNKLIFGMWESSYYNKQMDPFSIINITFDVDIASKVVDEIHAKGGKVDAISILNLVIYNESRAQKLYDYAQKQGVKIWFWTINHSQEAHDVIDFCKQADGSLLAGLITDRPKDVLRDEPEPVGHAYQFRQFFKGKLYSAFLYFLHNGYNLSPVFNLLAKLGLI